MRFCSVLFKCALIIVMTGEGTDQTAPIWSESSLVKNGILLEIKCGGFFLVLCTVLCILEDLIR